MNDDEQQVERFTMRLECVYESQKRSRLAFFTSIVISLGIMFSCFNAYFSWYRAFAFREGFEKTNDVTSHLQREILSEWVSSRMFVLPFLGIKAGPSDASIIGGVTLLVTATWFFYAIRRENHSIGTLLIDANSAPQLTKDTVFHVIASRMVFTTISTNDNPIDCLDAQSQAAPVPMIRSIVHLLMYFPFFAMVMIIGMDLASFFLDSPFRPTGQSPADESGGWRIAHHVTVNTIAVIICYVLWRICRVSIRFEQGTGNVLREFHQGLESQPYAT